MSPERTRWGLLILVVFGGVFAAFQVGKIPASLPVIRKDLGLDLVGAAWVISLLNLMGAAAGIAFGAVADWLGHRRVVLGGLVVTALAGLGGAFAQDTAGILVSRFFEGLGVILVFVASPMLIVRAVRPEHHRLAFGLWGTYMPLGTAVMVLLTPLLIGRFDWRGVWLINAALVLAFAAVHAWFTRDLRGGAAARSAGRLRTLPRDIRLTLAAGGPVVIALMFGGYAANFLAVTSFLPTLLIEEGQAVGTAAVLTGIVVLANVPGNLLGGWLLHKGAPRWLLMAIASAGMGAASFGIYAGGLAFELRYGCALCFTFIGGLLPSSALSGAAVHAPRPDLLGTTNGTIVQGTNLGQVAGPPLLAGAVAAAGGWHVSPWFVCTLAGSGVVLALVLRIIERRRFGPGGA